MTNFETMDITDFERMRAAQTHGGMPSRYREFLAELEDGVPTRFPLDKLTKAGKPEAADPTTVRNRRSQLIGHAKKLLEQSHCQRWAHFRYIIRASRDEEGEEEIWAMVPFRGDVEFEGAWDQEHAREIAEEETAAAHAPQAKQFKES